VNPAQRRILLCDELHPVALETLRAAGFEPELRLGLSEEELIAVVPGAHALIVRSATRVTRAVLEAADKLELVGRAGVGVDNVDTTAATERGVVVMNTPTGNTTTTGELAIALMCSLARNVSRADRRVRGGSWKKKGLMGSELTGKTLGVIGLGRIGRVVAERAQGLHMQVIGSDPYLSKTGSASPVEGVELLELDELLARSDFVTLHVPIGDGTRGLISKERLATMKPGARLINCARGGLVDEAELAAALDSGHLAGAALDVLAEEPPGPEHPLVGRDDVILTPHLGASSHEAQRNVAVQIAEQLIAFFERGEAQNAVNAPSVSAQVRKELGPYLLLAERMGSWLAQRTQEPIRKLELTLAGDIAMRDEGAIKLALLVAILRQSLDSGVNFVNAPLLAEERGLRVLEGSSADAQQYQNLIKVRASSKGGAQTHVVCGTVFGTRPRFVRVDDMHVDVAPEGPILITRHHDRPGVLGAVGGLLGERGINIRRVELGPPTESNSGFASAFLSLYDRPGPELVEELRGLELIESVHLVEL
jgi:D-3-phosphoglycerate dehydrogenase / 2-oxoglutarate reductase